jgi:hypothetical protein
MTRASAFRLRPLKTAHEKQRLARKWRAPPRFHLNPPTEVDFKNDDRAPLLIVGAKKDHTVPASLSHKQYEKYESRRRRPTTSSFPAART